MHTLNLNHDVVLAGPLSAVAAAHADYCSSTQAVGLTLNTLETVSQVYLAVTVVGSSWGLHFKY
jgi:hypothetical protein